MLRPTVSRPVSLGINTHLGAKTGFLLVLDSFGFVDVGRPLCREDSSVVYNCCWASPAQSFSGPSPAGLMTVLYYLRFETPITWRIRSLLFMSPRNRVFQLYSQAPDSYFVACYGSQDCGGGIRIRLHAGSLLNVYIFYAL
jgi:hypothetical protein